MPDIKHDPELPFAFISTANREVARFADREIAARFGKEVMVGSVVDTTPKPKIPEDANYIFVEDSDQSVFAYRIVPPDGSNGWMTVGGGFMNDEELLEYIGDEPVIVMIEKEDA